MEFVKKYYLVNVDKKGRIVIPKEIRDKMNIHGKVKIIVKNDVLEIRPVLKNLNYIRNFQSKLEHIKRCG